MNPVPFLELKSIYTQLQPELDQAYREVMQSGWYVLGQSVTDFIAICPLFGAKYCIGVANGLDALILSLKSLGVGKGDEVIVPSNTFIATVLAVTATGASPVLAEPHPETYNINPEAIEDAITERTKVILPVHLYGQACEMSAIQDLAQKNDLFMVEDNAQAQGATFRRKDNGTVGQSECHQLLSREKSRSIWGCGGDHHQRPRFEYLFTCIAKLWLA